MFKEEWRSFKEGAWQEEINVRDFIQKNYTPYEGNEDFLAGSTERTRALLKRYKELCRLEADWGGVLDIDTSTVSSLLNYSPGYVDKEKEIIVGLQTNRPLKRGVNPFGGIRMTNRRVKLMVINWIKK